MGTASFPAKIVLTLRNSALFKAMNITNMDALRHHYGSVIQPSKLGCATLTLHGTRRFCAYALVNATRQWVCEHARYTRFGQQSRLLHTHLTKASMRDPSHYVLEHKYSCFPLFSQSHFAGISPHSSSKFIYEGSESLSAEAQVSLFLTKRWKRKCSCFLLDQFDSAYRKPILRGAPL